MAAGSLVPEVDLAERRGDCVGARWSAPFALHSDSGTGRWQLEAWRPRAPFGLKAEGDDFG